MYKPRYIQYIHLPTIPQDIVAEAVANIPLHLDRSIRYANDNYRWSDFDNTRLDAWCKSNICQDIYFAFQLMTGDLSMHKDNVTKTKFNYLIQTGGDSVITTFYNNDKEMIESYSVETNRWHIIKVDTYHGVSNVQPGQIRFSVTGRIFE
jgi:hypothetical protein